MLITILSFLPVFALTGREGKMFHPLAYTKTFALVGVAILSITLVPALIPIFLRGRIKSEDENWLVRTMIEIFKPMLSWLMDRTTLVCWLFAVILGLGYVASTRLGREFMPDLDEQSIMDMPTTVPRASIAAGGATTSRVRDAVLRGFPEVWQVVGKAGRAETPTDPSPLDMIETIVNLRDRDALAQAEAPVRRRHRPRRGPRWPRWRRRGCSAAGPGRGPRGPGQRGGDDRRRAGSTRPSATWPSRRLAEFRPELGRALVGEAVDALLAPGRPPASLARGRPPAEREALVETLATTYGDRLAAEVLPDDVAALVARGRPPAGRAGRAPRPARPARARRRPRWSGPPRRPATSSGFARPTLFARIADHLAAEHDRAAQGADQGAQLGAVRPRRRRRHLGGPRGTGRGSARDRKLAAREPRRPANCQALRAALEKPFADRLLLWQKTKTDLVEEMSTALQMPGWGNSFTQPIANRIEMLSTGVRLPVGGQGLRRRASTRSSASARRSPGSSATVRGAADVFPDQITGKGYVEIHIDRKKAARYGINVGDVQDVVEVAMGGRPLTHDRRGPRALPGPRPLRPRLPRRRRVPQAHPRRRPRHGRRRGHGRRRDGRRDGAGGRRPPRRRPGAAGARSRWPSWPTSGWSRGRR